MIDNDDTDGDYYELGHLKIDENWVTSKDERGDCHDHRDHPLRSVY